MAIAQWQHVEKRGIDLLVVHTSHMFFNMINRNTLQVERRYRDIDKYIF